MHGAWCQWAVNPECAEQPGPAFGYLGADTGAPQRLCGDSAAPEAGRGHLRLRGWAGGLQWAALDQGCLLKSLGWF